MISGPATSRTRATAAANTQIAPIVTATLRRNGSIAPVARRRVRWGRIEVWTAWKSCIGARATSRTLKVKPARAVPCGPSVSLTSSGPALRNVCSERTTSRTGHAKPTPCASVNSGCDSSGSSIGSSLGSVASGDADCNDEREAQASGRLEQHECPVEPESSLPGQKAAGEVACGIANDGDEEDPVKRPFSAEHVCLERSTDRERDAGEGRRERELDGGRDP